MLLRILRRDNQLSWDIGNKARLLWLHGHEVSWGWDLRVAWIWVGSKVETWVLRVVNRWEGCFNDCSMRPLGERILDPFTVTVCTKFCQSLAAWLVIDVLFFSDLNKLLDFLAFLWDPNVNVCKYLKIILDSETLTTR